MRRQIITALAASLIASTMLASCAEEAPAAPEYTARQYMQAINDIARTDDQAKDAARLPGELLAFAQIDKGEMVGDYIMGGGYVSRLLAIAVGADGKVYAFQPDEFIAFRPEYATEQADTARRYSLDDGTPHQVLPLNGPVAEPPFPVPLDTIITVMNFHDLFISQMPAGTAPKAAASLFAALKPGGTLVVVDHLAAEGGGAEAADTLHRMDRALALETLTTAGFVLEEESDLYSRPDDPRDANVFDESINGRTDQFAMRLRKPA